MVLLDFSGIAIGSIMGQLSGGQALSESLVKHVIINNIRLFRLKFPESTYGKLVVCCDSKNNWRKEVYPEYKANRKKSRGKDKHDWVEIFKLIDETKKDLRDNFPYAVLEIDRAEADDLIGALTEHATRPLLGDGKVAIVSADKDFIQLHRLGDVVQWTPLFNKFIKEADPSNYMFEHVMKGDSGDGVPNILSPNNTFVEGIRQKPMTKKRIAEIKGNIACEGFGLVGEELANLNRNVKMILLDSTPKDIKEAAISQLETYKYNERSKILTYLISHKMKMLIENAGEF